MAGQQGYLGNQLAVGHCEFFCGYKNVSRVSQLLQGVYMYLAPAWHTVASGGYCLVHPHCGPWANWPAAVLLATVL